MRSMVFLLAIGSLATGCAFTDIPLTLPTTGLKDTVAGGDGRQIVVVIPLSDERQIRERCGMQKNGYNMDTADAICQSDPNTWLARLLADELRASGFEVITGEQATHPSAVRVEGSLLKIFVEPVIGAWSGSLEADLSVRLEATSQTGLVANRTFLVKGWRGGVMASTVSPYHVALERATHAIVEEMVRAILELTERTPQLGSQPFPDFRRLSLGLEGRS